MSDIAEATGISRQAAYLHFASRTELLVAVTPHLDEVLDVDRRLAPSRAAQHSPEVVRYSSVGLVPNVLRSALECGFEHGNWTAKPLRGTHIE
jgi:hypothetical protein